ncbi:helix-turn-helix transcriptional regulator [Spiribacter halobius]
MARVLNDELHVRGPAERPFVPPADRRARRAWQLLTSRPYRELSLEAIAAEVGASPRTLNRVFTREFGMSVATARQHLRMRSAKACMETGDSVQATARRLGYRDTGSFIDAFRRAFGLTPGSYREIFREGQLQASLAPVVETKNGGVSPLPESVRAAARPLRRARQQDEAPGSPEVRDPG